MVFKNAQWVYVFHFLIGYTLFNCEIVFPILKFNKNVLKNKIKKVS